MNGAPDPREIYVVATDFSPASAPAIDAAERIAVHTHAELDFLCVVPTTARGGDGDELADRARIALGRLARDPARAGVVTSAQVMGGDDGSAASAARAAARGAAMAGAAPRGATDWRTRLLGGVTERLLRNVPRSLLVARRPRPGSRERMLLALDRSPGAARALRRALELAPLLGAEVHAVHVVSPRGSALHVDEAAGASPRHDDPAAHTLALERLQALIDAVPHAGLDVDVRVVGGSPAVAIVQEARRIRATLVVVGLHSRSRLQELFVGSVARAVATASPSSVLLTRPR